MTSPSSSVVAGFHLVEQKKTHDPTIEKWVATRDGMASELYIVPTDMKERIAGLPNIVGFSKVEMIEEPEQIVVVVPGQLVTTASNMLESFGPTYSACFAWHISDLLSVLHQSGQAHNWLHPESIGINQLGQLEIRPAFGAFLRTDPDASASAIATDCWQMGYVFERMGVTEKLDNRLALLTNGLRQDLSRLRIQPATAIRQSLSVVLARNAKWEEDFVEQLGTEWALNQRTFREHSIIPHRLESEPKVKLQQSTSKSTSTSTSDLIDLWGNPFSSTEIRDASSSSGQALLREAFASNMSNTVVKMPNQEISFEDEVSEMHLENPSSLEVDLPGDSLQVPIQSSSVPLQAIQEIGLEEDFSLSALMGMRSIVEENDVVEMMPIVEEVDAAVNVIAEKDVASSDESDEIHKDPSAHVIDEVVEIDDSVLEVGIVEESISEPVRLVEEALLLEDRPMSFDVSEEVVEVPEVESVVEQKSPDTELNIDVAEDHTSVESLEPRVDTVEEPIVSSIIEVALESSPSVMEESVIEQVEEPVEEFPSIVIPEPEGAVMIQDMDDYESVDDADEGNDDGPVVGVFLGGIPLIPIIEEVSEDPEVTGAILDTESPSLNVMDNPFDYVDESPSDGFVASFDVEQSPVFTGGGLDVEEPLAAVEFPSIEEVRSQDASFSGDLDTLFGGSEPVVSTPESRGPRSVVQESSGVEPKWTGATAFDNLTDSENALGDEKYNMEQVELGDVDAVLSESIRDYSEVEQKGSIWGMLLVATIIVAFGVLYLLNPQKSEETTEPLSDNVVVDMTGNTLEMAPRSSTVSIQTNPPQGRVYIDNVEVGVAPVAWEATEGDVFMMCVDWGSNPICRRISKVDLKEQYTFEQVLTP